MARYLISPEAAQEKAERLQELVGGKNALRLHQALEAVAFGCGFDRWRELVATNARLAAGEANSLGISAAMLADDQHVDEATLEARRTLQLDAVRGVITCLHARAQELARQWSLSGPPQALETTSQDGEPDDKTGRLVVDGNSQHALQEALDDAFLLATPESCPDELPYASTSTPPSRVAVTYKKRRLPADER